jgi:hypothetical protein
MPTVNAYATTPPTELRTPTTVDRSQAADEPSHIHLPRPRRRIRTDAPVAPVERAALREPAHAGPIS